MLECQSSVPILVEHIGCAQCKVFYTRKLVCPSPQPFNNNTMMSPTSQMVKLHTGKAKECTPRRSLWLTFHFTLNSGPHSNSKQGTVFHTCSPGRRNANHRKGGQAVGSRKGLAGAKHTPVSSARLPRSRPWEENLCARDSLRKKGKKQVSKRRRKKKREIEAKPRCN